MPKLLKAQTRIQHDFHCFSRLSPANRSVRHSRFLSEQQSHHQGSISINNDSPNIRYKGTCVPAYRNKSHVMRWALTFAATRGSTVRCDRRECNFRSVELEIGLQAHLDQPVLHTRQDLGSNSSHVLGPPDVCDEDSTDRHMSERFTLQTVQMDPGPSAYRTTAFGGPMSGYGKGRSKIEQVLSNMTCAGRMIRWRARLHVCYGQ